MNELDVTFRDERDWVNFGDTYVNSEAFRVLFREGMTMVEEAAAYLDGDGREESRLLSRDSTLSYASESMRLTTRLMQIASWLLVQRAVSEARSPPPRPFRRRPASVSRHRRPSAPRPSSLSRLAFRTSPSARAGSTPASCISTASSPTTARPRFSGKAPSPRSRVCCGVPSVPPTETGLGFDA